MQRVVHNVVLDACAGDVRDVVCMHVYIYVQVCVQVRKCVYGCMIT